MTRDALLQYALDRYHVAPEYPWSKFPGHAVLRHQENRKWFGLVLGVEGRKLGLPTSEVVDILNVKCDPRMVGSLLGTTGFLPAYHMNKEQWLSILLDGPPAEETLRLLDLSYQLTAQKAGHPD